MRQRAAARFGLLSPPPADWEREEESNQATEACQRSFQKNRLLFLSRKRRLHTIGALPCCRVGCWRSRLVPLGDGDHKDRELCSDTVAWNGSKAQKCMSLIKPAEAAAAIERYLGIFA